MAAGLGLALLPGPAFGQSAGFPAQAYVWKSVVMKGGGFIDGIVFNPTQPGLAYCRTDVGSAYRWDNQAKVWVALTDWVADDNLRGGEHRDGSDRSAARVYRRGDASERTGGHPAFDGSGQNVSDGGRAVPDGRNENGRGVGERLAIDRTTTTFFISVRARRVCGGARTRR